MALSLVSINIERDKHFERFMPFLKKRAPDVICFQELFEKDIVRITNELGGEIRFVPFMKYDTGEPIGIGMWTALPFREVIEQQYAGHQEEGLRTHSESATPDEKYKLIKDILLVAEIEKEGTTYRIATTHFVWTPDGQANEQQRRASTALLGLLHEIPEYILCGDFNAPRGGEIFERFSSELKDNIPAEYDTSLDPELHRAKGLRYMVDVLFTTPTYTATNVELVFGISDHAVVSALITKNAS